MAVDWTPMRNDLADDPAVVSMSMALKIDPDTVAGKLLRVWGWAGPHTTTGKCAGVGKAHVDYTARCEKFGDAMEAAGWMRTDPEGNVTFTKWSKWNGKAAKKRLQTAIRVARLRERNKRNTCNAPVTRVTQLQYSTVQKSNTEEVEEVPAVKIAWTRVAGWSGVTDADREQWGKAYPACDIGRQLEAMTAWLIANPDKVKSNWRRFVTNWLSRAQDNGGDKRGHQAGGTGSNAARVGPNRAYSTFLEAESERRNGLYPDSRANDPLPR